MFGLLDVRTLLLSGALTGLTLAGVMAYYSFARRTYPGFHYWTAAIMSAGAGVMLVSLRGVLPDFITIILGNGLLVLLPFLTTRGLELFTGIRSRWVWGANSVLLAGFLGVFVWATYVAPDPRVRILCLSLVMSVAFLEALVVALKHIPPVLQERNWLLVVALGFSIFALLFRIGIVASNSSVVLFMENGDPMQNVSILISILAAITIPCSLLILNTHRMERDLGAALRRIENLANQDGLTGISNRRFFDAKLEQEFKRLQRGGQPISLIMADVDCFKLYNDTYGHQAGDDCLRNVAGVFQRSGGRVSDVAARYGGEEFVMLLPNTDAHGARRVAETLRDGVAALAIPHATSTVSDVVTLSIGVATVHSDRSMAPAELVGLADQALYESKTDGKDRIRVSDPAKASGRPHGGA